MLAKERVQQEMLLTISRYTKFTSTLKVHTFRRRDTAQTYLSKQHSISIVQNHSNYQVYSSLNVNSLLPSKHNIIQKKRLVEQKELDVISYARIFSLFVFFTGETSQKICEYIL